MNVLVTGSSGHLGEALMRMLPAAGHRPLGLDLVPSTMTDAVGDVADPAFVAGLMTDIDAVIHTATLHKPHVVTHSKRAFVDTNITGTLTLLEAAVTAGVSRFIFTSTTSAFGAALSPPPGEPAAWIDETVVPVPKNIYGVTKTAAEDLCALIHRRDGLPCLVLRTARFFPEEDDDPVMRRTYDAQNIKANEYLYRRVDLEDAAQAHIDALAAAPALGFDRLIISATSPFAPDDLLALRTAPDRVVAAYFPDFAQVYARCGYRMAADIARVYVNDRARQRLGWHPRYDFRRILDQIDAGEPIGSDLARAVGVKGYHAETFTDGPFPVE